MSNSDQYPSRTHTYPSHRCSSPAQNRTMPTDKSIGNQPSIGGSGESSKSTLDFKSLASIDMKRFSLSELYTLSRSTSDDPVDIPENDVTPNVEVIKSSHRPTCSIFTSTNSPRRIFAFSHWRRPSGFDSDDSDDSDDDVAMVSENKSILNSIQKLISGDDSPAPELLMLPAPAPVGDLPKRKRKWNSENEFEGLGIVNVNGEAVDLKLLARAGDEAFDSELNKLSEGMVAENEFLGVIRSLDGRWSSNRKRRKFVDAGFIVKVLPDNWKILLSLRPRARKPALYCREFISPLGKPFKSCKDVAFYLKSLCATNNANNPEEGAVMLVKPNCIVDLESGASVHRSFNPVMKTNNLGTDNRMGSSKSIVGLESPLQRLGTGTLKRKLSAPHGVLFIREPQNPPPNYVKQKTSPSSSTSSSSCSLNPTNSKTRIGPEGLRRFRQKTIVENKDTRTKCIELNYISTNREGSSSSGPKKDPEWNLKTICFLCLAEFIRKPVDPDTLSGSLGFICPKCKEASLTWLAPRADK